MVLDRPDFERDQWARDTDAEYRSGFSAAQAAERATAEAERAEGGYDPGPFNHGHIGPDVAFTCRAGHDHLTAAGQAGCNERAEAATAELVASIRRSIENESVSYGELAALQDLAAQGNNEVWRDEVLAEWAGIAESDFRAYADEARS